MGEVIGLQDRQLIENDELILDLCRFRENLATEQLIRRKHRLDNATWERLGSDEGNALVEKVEEASARRIRDGSVKRELAQKHIVRGPDILNGIMSGGSDVSPKHKIDAIRTLDGMAANGPAGVPASDRFVIQIVLGDGPGETLTFDKSLKPDGHVDDTLAITASVKDGGSGEPV